MTTTDLLVFPLLNSQPSGIPYSSNNPPQVWQRPLQAGENPTDDFIYQYLSAIDGKFHTFVINKGQAATPNVYTVGVTTQVESNLPANPPPSDPTKLPTGSIISVTPFGLIINTPIQAPPTDPFETRVISGINTILTALGKPTI